MEKIEVDRGYIRDTLQKIVDIAHTHHEKKEVREKADQGFQIACPYCGDSEKSYRKYRGNLNGILFYKCFNDGCFKQTHFTQMCKDFNVDIDIDTKRSIYDYLDNYTNKVDTLQNELAENGLNNLISLKDLEDCINNNKCDSQLSNFKPIQKGSAQFYYLIENRGLTDPRLWDNIYQADFHVTGDWIEKSIIFLNKRGDKVIGAQMRNLKEGYKRKFKIYTFTDLYEWVGGTNELSEGQLMMYDKLSYYYGILELNFSKQITIFEGYGDALLFPNSLGLAGVNTEMYFMENNGLDIRYFYDNDNAGHQKTEEKIREGFPCFLWNKMFEFIVDKKKANDPFHHMYNIKKTKDLTNLNKVVPDCYISLEMEKYFSNDILDLRYVPKIKRKWNKYIKKNQTI